MTGMQPQEHNASESVRLTLKIGGMTCAACSANVQKALSKLDGITSAEVNIATEKAVVTYLPSKIGKPQMEQAVKAAGYFVIDRAMSAEMERIGKQKEIRRQKVKLTIALCFAIPVFYIAMAPMIPFVTLPYPAFLHPDTYPATFALLQLVLVLPVMGAGYQFYTGGFHSLFRLSPNMDSLVAVSTTAAFVYSVISTVRIVLWGEGHLAHHGLYFESVAVIIALILLGKFLEARSKGKTGEAIRALMSLAPKTATVRRGGETLELSVDEVVLGDTVLIRPGQSMPVDGIISEGETAVDESMLTGESMPVDKHPGDRVYAATINKNGSIAYTAEKVGEDTALAQIVRMVEDAAGSKAPIAHLADRISGWFTPAVLGIALLSAIVWFFVRGDLEFALSIFISVLVIACPCALGLATPTAIIVGTGKGAQSGVLFKNAAALQATHQIHTVLFDKTGTITEGRPVVCDVLPLSGKGGEPLTETELLQIAASLERFSEHPLGQAIVTRAEELHLEPLPTEQFRAVTGFGAQARVNGREIKIGNPAYLNMAETPKEAHSLAAEGKTPLFLSMDGVPRGMISVADRIKDTSREAMAKLHQMGIETVMLTGDNQQTADAVARAAGIDKVLAGVLPEGKVAAVERCKRDSHLTAMVGDGINDAPALTAADVGIAVGSGTDVAIESADVVLVKNNLNDVVTAIRLSQATIRNIKQNLFWAFCYNTLGIPVAAGLLYAFGGPLLNPMIAAAAMSLSSVCVVGNALRLNRFR